MLRQICSFLRIAIFEIKTFLLWTWNSFNVEAVWCNQVWICAFQLAWRSSSISALCTYWNSLGLLTRVKLANNYHQSAAQSSCWAMGSSDYVWFEGTSDSFRDAVNWTKCMLYSLSYFVCCLLCYFFEINNCAHLKEAVVIQWQGIHKLDVPKAWQAGRLFIDVIHSNAL